MQKDNFSNQNRLQFNLICLLMVFLSLKPEFIIPGSRSLTLFRSVPTLITVALFLLWCVNGSKVLSNTETKLFLSFYGIMLFDTLTARHFGFAWSTTKGFTAIVFLFLACTTFVTDIYQFKKVINIFLYCNIFIIILGINEGGLVKNIPALTDENDFSLLMDMLVPFYYFCGLYATKFKTKLFYFSCVGLSLIGIVLSFSRGGFVGLICSLIYCYFYTEKKAIIILGFVIIVLSALVFVPKSYWTEMQTIEEGTQENTAAARIYYWGNAIKIYIHHPILGVGPKNSGVWIPTYDKSARGQRDWGRALHSVYFTLLSETGTIGTLIFILMIYYGEKSRKSIRKSSKTVMERLDLSNSDNRALLNCNRDLLMYSHALTGALIGFLTAGIFLSVLYYAWFWLITMYTVMLYNISQTINKVIDKKLSES